MTDETGATVKTAAVPARLADFEAAWKGSATGVVLTATARRLNLPYSPGALAFTGVPDDRAAQAEAAVIRGGLDPDNVDLYEPPEPVEVPPAYWAAVAALGAVVLATSVTLARTQVATLRSYLGRLIAVGVPPRWTRQVLLVQSALVVVTATALALAFALPPIVVAAARLPDLTLVIPWSWLGITLGAVYLAVAVATLISGRRLRAGDRLYV